MSQTIDITGLTPDGVRAVESLVGLLRNQSAPPTIAPPPDETREEWVKRFQAWVESHAVPPPPPAPSNETPEEWTARFTAWAASHPSTNPAIDDSRESIYEGCGE